MTPEDVLGFWFAEGMDERWFVTDEAFDATVREALGEAYRQAADDVLDTWRDCARGCLALVLLLDQVPRNLFRGDPRAYATDGLARTVTRLAIERAFDRELTQCERCFLYLPFEHSEDLADQERCVALMAGLDEDPGWRDYAARHRDIVARFGRFPHRNHCLGRESTREEAAFLKTPNSSF